MAAQESVTNTPATPLAENTTILIWKSSSRPFKKRDREFFTTIGAFVFLIAVILLLLKEFLAIGVLLALMFVSYVLATAEPEIVEHSISTNGFTSMGHFYKWEELLSFWFGEKWGQSILTVSFKLRPFSRLIILVPPELQEKVKGELKKYLTFQEKPEKTWLDNAADWLAKKVPLETES